MAAVYHVRVKGKEHGPFNGRQLKKLADSGQISPDDEVRQGDDETWHAAGSVKGLFDDAPAAKKKAKPGGTAAGSNRPSRRKPSRDSDILEIEDDEDELEFLDEDDDDDIEYDDDEDFEDSLFEEDDDEDLEDLFEEDRGKPGKGRGKKRSKSRPRERKRRRRAEPPDQGLLVMAIGAFLFAGSWGLQALHSALGLIGSLSLLPLMHRMTQLDALLQLGAMGTFLAGAAVCLNERVRDAGLAITAIVLTSVTALLHLLATVIPVVLRRNIMGDAREGVFVLAGLSAFAACVLGALLLRGIANELGRERRAEVAFSLIWIAVAAIGIAVVGELIDSTRSLRSPIALRLCEILTNAAMLVFSILFGITAQALRE